MLLLAIPVFAAVALLMPTAGVLGQAKKKRETPTQSDDQLAKAIVTLHHVKATLEKANHDYGGHRMAAVRDVNVASHQLHLALETVHKGKKNAKEKTKDGKAGKESQKLSDAQLAAAIPELKLTYRSLMQANHNYGGHREKAVVDLGAAIVSLEKALVFSKMNNPR